MSGCIGFFLYKGYFPREGDFGCFIPERALHSAAALNTFLDSVIMTHANERDLELLQFPLKSIPSFGGMRWKLEII